MSWGDVIPDVLQCKTSSSSSSCVVQVGTFSQFFVILQGGMWLI